jgi:threonine/homoserine/homoserine lactone efflux protein
MSDPHPTPDAPRERESRSRDAQVATALGAFLAVIALPVLAGTWYATLPVDRWINGVAGLLLLGVGIGFLLRGRRP